MAITVDGIDVHVEGGGDETIVMIHGWPDTHRLWDSTVAHFRERYKCVRFTLPGYDIAKPRRAYSIDEIADFMRRVIEQVSPGRKVILLVHDWGCFFGYQFYARRPDKVSRIVGVDIGDPRSTRRILTGREKLIMVSYQTWNALAWKFGGRIGTWMTRALAKLGSCPSDRAPMSFGMGYPYWLLWFGGRDSYKHHVRRFEPACPMLFVYGVHKPMRFHSKAWADELAAKPGNRVVEFDTGHWVMSDQPQRFNEVVTAWLAR